MTSKSWLDVWGDFLVLKVAFEGHFSFLRPLGRYLAPGGSTSRVEVSTPTSWYAYGSFSQSDSTPVFPGRSSFQYIIRDEPCPGQPDPLWLTKRITEILARGRGGAT